MDPNTLIHRYLIGEASEAEVQELDQRLAQDPELRKQLIFEAGNDAGLREIALERMAEPASVEEKIVTPSFRPIAWAIAACAAVMLIIFATWQLQQSDIVATLVSNEDAAWESALPTMPGSKLTSGVLKLKSGMSTIRFASGAEVVLEAPAQLELLDAMRGRLITGSAIIDVPDSAIGFVMETPDGYAVDYGTQFAVRVDGQHQRSDFELIEGEIAVHHPESGDEVRLTEQGKTASVSKQAMVVIDSDTPVVAEESEAKILRIRTHGRYGSIRINPGKRKPRQELLLARRNISGDSNAHCFFAFDLSAVDFDQIASAQLRVNLVPSKSGSAARLPKINRFAIHGLTNAEKADWKNDSTWATAPQPEDGTLLGKFEIPRSQKRGSFGVGTGELLDFLKANQDREVTLILSRETRFIVGPGGKGLTHNFASESHPEAVGPTLEFTLKSE